MTKEELRLELLKLVRGASDLPMEAEAAVTSAKELEKFIYSKAPDNRDSEQH